MLNVTQKTDILKRISKIEGQVHGIHKMVMENRYCIDILTQTRAVAAALRKVEDRIMSQHLHTCVADSMKSSNQADINTKIDEIMDLLARFRKSG